MKKFTGKSLTKNQTFWSDTRGSIAIVMAISVLMLLVSTGVAIDFSSAHNERTKLQLAADAAALAAARITTGNPADNISAGELFFKANYPEHANANIDVDIVGDAIKVSAEKVYSTKLLPIVGIHTVPLDAVSEVTLPTSGSAEIVLVLDYSDSMLDNDKYIRLKDAAHQMIDSISSNGTNPNVKFGIVPFAALVHADLPAEYIRSDVTYTGCTQDRRYPSNTQETAGFDDDSKWGEITSTHPCTGMAAVGLKVVPLSSDIPLVKSKLDAMQPYLWTHIALGAEFGRQVISPTGPFANASDYTDTSTVKVFVLLTDGMQTAPGWGPAGTQTTAHGENNLKEICTQMKAQDIEVYTVGYDLTDAHTLNILQDCANSGKFFDAQDVSTGLLSSFGTIATQVTTSMMRLSR